MFNDTLAINENEKIKRKVDIKKTDLEISERIYINLFSQSFAEGTAKKKI